MREGYLPPDVPLIEPVRLRRTTDTIESLRKEYLVPLTINAREEYPAMEFVVKQRVGLLMGKGEHGMQRRYCVRWETEDIEIIPYELIFHDWQNWPMKIESNRFIVGRPNPVKVPIWPINWE